MRQRRPYELRLSFPSLDKPLMRSLLKRVMCAGKRKIAGKHGIFQEEMVWNKRVHSQPLCSSEALGHARQDMSLDNRR